MNRYLTILLLFVSIGGFSQTAVDTIGIMQYNLLSYRTSIGNCNNSNNNASDKEGYMNTIVSYLLPDIIACNEISADGGTAANRLLTNALNKNGRNYYKQCNYSANSGLCNMLYYNSNKFELYKQDKIERAANGTFFTRQVDVYTLYYTNSSSLTNGDTTFVVFYVTHLKAGSTSNDRNDRERATAAIMEYHENNYADANYFIAGDFNIRSGSETSYENLIEYSNTSVRFNDPKNRKASWNSNSLYADLHTQSTRSSTSNGGCFSTGGLDDRFDFILCGQEVLDNTRGINYIDGSYRAVGNDALHFNKDILSPANNSVPGNVLSALYNMSDHLPVYMEVGVTRSTVGIKGLKEPSFIFTNPVTETLRFKSENGSLERLLIVDLQGKMVLETGLLNDKNGWQAINCTNLESGIYIICGITKQGATITYKLVKQ
jgi:hypothetical protein